MTKFDVLIVGAGPAGAVAGIALARAGARVRLIDRAKNSAAIRSIRGRSPISRASA
jgi:phenol 2-monooxygenase